MNIKGLSSFWILVSIMCCACAQHKAPHLDRDSVTLVDAQWQSDSLREGLVLKTHHFRNKTYMASNQYIAYLEVSKAAAQSIAFIHNDSLTTTSKQATHAHAHAAINGTYFDMDKGNPICYLRINGKEIGENTPGKDTIHRKYYQYASLVLDSNNLLSFCIPDSGRFAERDWDEPNVMTAGPMLIISNKILPQRQDRTFVTVRHNRTALGCRADGTIILFTVDGRTKQSEGMTLHEVAKTLHYLGCVNAINLDGGGSTTLWTNKYGIVNHPSDNGRFDKAGERPVSSCILIK
ncbi:MAG: phosphodiester glycosidase family protein [Bacteroidales bacterium]|nr:phosphodiester glycosidase family protein [Bacteroidales bacterium]